MSSSSIAERWEVLSGSTNWKGLTDPLDLDLRNYLIHYGQMTEATYETFNAELASKYAGSSRYSEANLFAKVGLDKGNPYKYEVTKYFYATSSYTLPDAFIIKPIPLDAWSRESNWMGYVAVATDEGKTALGRRDIIVCWRGTIRTLEWVSDLEFLLVPAPEIFGAGASPQVHRGFYNLYSSENPDSAFNIKSARDQVLGEVKRLVELYKNEEVSITVCGHSLGAALATLNAIDIAKNGTNTTSAGKSFPVTGFVYASPRTGDHNFKNAYDATPNLHLMRIRNVPDIVPQVPPATPLIGYTDVGVELTIDVTKSGYVKPPGDLASWHLLEPYLHGIAGTKGAGLLDGFELVVDRDISLVNKLLDYLKEEYCIPGNWWIEKNKGMVQQDDGSWKLLDNEEGYVPLPP
ncbi:PREDICTED: phospholipase A1-IIgamma-like [Ipomoea nil]|uniref:phospholipase A1-IIgamma-like n=1 Tax=Ipomoea nil TaxID=35883 RepID=UPI000900BD58|nr:PREDICTED: phospholipase A1-IIgamma-like [Ipomoea nil]